MQYPEEHILGAMQHCESKKKKKVTKSQNKMQYWETMLCLVNQYKIQLTSLM